MTQRTREPRDCKLCDVEFTPTHWNQTHCTKACATEAKRIRQIANKPPCGYCGGEITDTARYKHCSDKCRRQMKLVHQELVRAEDRNMQCRECSVGFVSFNKVKYCSDDCRNEVIRRRAREYLKASYATTEGRARNLANSHKRRVRITGADSEQFSPEDLTDHLAAFDTCYICGYDLDGDVHTDHVRPLHKGGVHALKNLRPTHAICNRSKNGKWPFGPAERHDIRERFWNAV